MDKIIVAGIGPGSREHMTGAVIKALKEADVIIGYSTYTGLIEKIVPQKEILSFNMRKEIKRCETAIEEALKGKKTVVISSGDSGLYGMAGLILEIIEARGLDIDVEILPGITAAFYSASVLGAPVMHDCALISLSDLLTPLQIIEKRIKYAAKGDFVICLYNPKSKKRIKQIEKAVRIISKYRNLKTPVGIVKNAGRENQQIKIVCLENVLKQDIDMSATVIIGNSKTYVSRGKMITPRGYEIV